MRRQPRLESVAGACADEFSRLRGEKFVDGARVFALDRLTGEDHGAAVDLMFGETGVAVAAVDEVAECGGVDQIIRTKRRYEDRRAPHELAADHDKAAGEALRLPLQSNFCKQQVRGRTADVDADGRECQIVLRPDRVRERGAFGQRLAMFVGKVGLVHRQSNSAQPAIGASMGVRAEDWGVLMNCADF